ncbi:MAG: molybdenum cofactor guanylyltransferase [Planctomycetota bacterium]
MGRPDLTGLVLCGGRSSRMGADKAALTLHGRTLLERAAATFDGIAVETLLACGASARYEDLGLPLVLDRMEGTGPLAGLEAGLARARTPWVAALACDMPRAAPEAFLALQDHAIAGNLDLCHLTTEKGVEPLFAVYHRNCLEPVRAALAAGQRRVVAFHDFPASAGRPLRIGTIHERDLPGALVRRGVARNVNTPADLTAEAAAWSPT